MKYSIVFLLTIFCGGSSVGGATEKISKEQDSLVSAEVEKKAVVRILTEQLSAGLISADAGWEVFSNLMDGERRDKLLIYINILAEFQKIDPKNLGYRISIKGVFIRDCSAVLSVPRETLLKNFSTQIGNDKNEEGATINARKLFLGLHNGEVEGLKDKKDSEVP